jgi:hypothetical protein
MSLWFRRNEYIAAFEIESTTRIFTRVRAPSLPSFADES